MTTLWHIELSHYSEKARFALDYKRVTYRVRTPMVGTHQAIAMALTRSRHRRFPVLKLDGERAIGDSTAIVAALEQRFPDPPLYPADPQQRARALELEDYFDEELATGVRAFAFFQVFGERGGLAEAIAPHRPTWNRMLRLGEPMARFLIRTDYGATAEGAERARAKIVAAADRIEAELQPSGYLVGDRFSVADLTGAALFTPLLAPPGRPFLPNVAPPKFIELREEITARPAGQWVHEIYAKHRQGPASRVPATV
jgi:glutathione S-transferase